MLIPTFGWKMNIQKPKMERFPYYNVRIVALKRDNFLLKKKSIQLFALALFWYNKNNFLICIRWILLFTQIMLIASYNLSPLKNYNKFIITPKIMPSLVFYFIMIYFVNVKKYFIIFSCMPILPQSL